MDLNQALQKEGAFLAGEYDIAVVGAGHAGCEAALSAARLGYRTILFGMNLDVVANMPCNPSIGGTAKGQLVREIDALGGEMGRQADRAMIQFRLLNASKGPAVLSPRAQIDRRLYQSLMKQVVERQAGLSVRQGEVTRILYISPEPGINKRKIICGVMLRTGAVFACKALILATGTFLESRIIIGEFQQSSGPDSLFPARGLSASLRELDLPLARFKTGTPVRVNRRSIDFSSMEIQEGDPSPLPFSYDDEAKDNLMPKGQMPCYLTYTTDETRRVIRNNLHRSPLFSGAIDGVGPRYCPSVEDKFVKFPDKKRHQVFIEPTGIDTEEMYLQGMSSSMPEEVQVQMVRSLPGMSKAQIMRSAYAIEYDCIDPTALSLNLECKNVQGLFCAGQINGSSGYEEAAAQGLLAGINAVHYLKGKHPVIIDRSQGYIGVLIDDLVTKGTSEPYRMMTSRAEYRLLLRHDNADSRLTALGRNIGLITSDRWRSYEEKQERIAAEIRRCRETRVSPTKPVQDLLQQLNSAPISGGASLADLLRRPEISYAALGKIDPSRPSLKKQEQYVVEVDLKYEGYIKLEKERINHFQKNEHKELPVDIDYLAISGLRLEARQKLDKLRPVSIGQASRISGVSPADLSVLLVYLQARGRKK